MSQHYVGYFIRVHLSSGDIGEGKVASVDPISQTITLQNVRFQKDTNIRPLVVLQGSDIKDLEILPSSSSSSTSSIPTSAPAPAPLRPQPQKLEEFDPAIISYSPSPVRKPSLTEEQRAPVARKLNFGQSEAVHATAPVFAPSVPVPNKGQNQDFHGSPPQHHGNHHQSPHKKSHSKHNNHKAAQPKSSGSLPGTGEYAVEHYSPQKPRRGGRDRDEGPAETWDNDVSVDEDFQKDFDYHGNLQHFDKAKIFAQIQEEDRINPQNRLVYHNKQPRKLGHRENVLESTELHEDSNSGGEVTGFTSTTNVPIPIIRNQQRKQVFQRASKECGMSESQFIENFASNVGNMILQTVGASRRINLKNPSQSPLVVVLVGNTKNGAYGLGLARYLANHNIRVKACLLEPEEKRIQFVLSQLTAFSFTDSVLIQTRSEVEALSQDPIDLIVDAMLGADGSDHMSAELNFMINWANSTKMNILSLDIPSGMDGDTTKTLQTFIRAKWVVTFILPLPGHLNPGIRGELFLVDLGIPRAVFGNLGFQYRSPFTDKGSVMLIPNGS